MTLETNVIIKSKPRDLVGRKVKKLRKEGKVPAVVYGPDFKSKNITVDLKEFIKAYKDAGESSLIDLIIDKDSPVKVLVKDVDIDYVNRKILHVSFYKVNMKEEIDADVPIVLINDSLAVKEGGVLVHTIQEVPIRCFPADLPSQIEVDITTLEKIGDSILLGDIKIPEGVTLMRDEEDLTQSVVNIIAPVTEEQEAALMAEGEAPIEEVEATEQGEEEDGEEISEENEKGNGLNRGE